MQIIAVIIALFIFANPYISVLDLLPDVLGCILILFATAHVEVFSPKIEEARRLFVKLAFLTGADALLANVIPANDSSMRLLFVFVFRIAEGAMLYLAATKMIDGVMYLGTKFDTEAVFAPASKHKMQKLERREQAEREKLDRILERERKRYERGTADSIDEEHRHRATERYRRVVAKISADASRARREKDGITKLTRSMLLFIAVRTAMCVLPEFTALYEISGDVTSGYVINIANYRGMFISLGFIVTLVVSVIWLCGTIRYVAGISHDRRFILEVREKYADFSRDHDELYLCRRILASLVLLGIGTALSFDFFVEYINFVPDFTAAVFLLLFFLVIPQKKRVNIPGVVLSAAYAALSVAQWAYVLDYINKFADFTRTSSSESAFSGYVICCVLTAASVLLFAALAVLIYRELASVIQSHTGYKSEIGEIDERTKYLRASLRKQNIRSLVFAMLSAVSSIVYMISLGFNKQVLVEDETSKYYIYIPRFESMGAINTVIAIVYVIITVKYLSDIHDSVKERYKFL